MSDKMGGSFESTFQLIKNIPDRFDCKLTFSGHGRASKRAENYGLEYDILENYSGYEGKIGKIMYMGQAREYLSKLNPDIVHVNDLQTLHTWGIPAAVSGSKVIFHLRGEYLNSRLIYPLIPIIDHVIFVSYSNKQYFDSTLLKHATSSVVYNGVDTSVYNRAENSNRDGYLIGYVGDLVSRKRPDLFVKSALELLQRRDDIEFYIAGRNSENLWEICQTLIHEHNQIDKFNYLGFIDDIPKLMNEIDLLFLTSTPQGEAFPRTPIEAMACGTPVITSNTAGVTESVISGECGFVLSENPSPNQFARTADMVLNDPDLLSELKQCSNKRVKENFDINLCVKDTIEIYDSLMSSG